MEERINNFRQKAIETGYHPVLVEAFIRAKTSQAGDVLSDLGEGVSKILPMAAQITQKFGNRSAVERFSKGVNYGTDFAIPTGTKVALPPGEWEVLDSFAKATASGPKNKQLGINRGYGNSILVRNKTTGEKLRFSHLSRVGARKGQTLQGGAVIGLSGATGNVAGRTGQHLDLEYYNSMGKIADVLRSRYARTLY